MKQTVNLFIPVKVFISNSSFTTGLGYRQGDFFQILSYVFIYFM